MKAVCAVFLKVDELLTCILDASRTKTCGVVLVAGKQLDDGARKRGAAHEHHALDLLLTQKRHDAAGDRGINPRGGTTLAETVEIIVVEEQLRDEEARSRIDLLLQVLDVDLRVDAIDMPLGIRRSAHAKTGIGKRRDKILRKAELGGLNSCRDITAQCKDVLDVVRTQILDGGCNRRRGRPSAGEVRDADRAEVRLDDLGHIVSGMLVAAAARRVGDGNEVGAKRGEASCNLARGTVVQIALRREDLERERWARSGSRFVKQLLYRGHDSSFCIQ